MLGFSGSVGWSNILYAELMGLLKGMLLCWEEGYRKVQCFTDSLETIRLLNEANTLYHLYGNEVALLRKLLQRNWQVHISHIYREGNSCADWFAKTGARNNADFTVCRNPPTDLGPLLIADANGTRFVRP